MDNMGNKIYLKLPPEDDYGNVEYKWDLSAMTRYKRHRTTSQMKWRVYETTNLKEAWYVIGVHDNGNVTGLSRDKLFTTWCRLMDCARSAGLYTCMAALHKIDDVKYWAVVYVFESTMSPKQVNDDINLKKCQKEMPVYLKNVTRF